MKKEKNMELNPSLLEMAGTPIPDSVTDLTVENIFKATGLDWEVEQHPVHSAYGPISNMVANFRSDDKSFLGMVHPTEYKVVQNIEAFNFIDELPNFTYEKVGMFQNGRKVFVVGKSNEQIDIDGSGDLVDFYLTFLHGHDGKSGIKFILCPIRMFCMNQMNLMLEKATFKYNIIHRGDVYTKLDQVQSAIANSKNYVVELGNEFQTMINTKPSIDIDKFTELLIPDEEDDNERKALYKSDVRNFISDLYKNKPDLQNYKDTVFGMISAVSDYVSHATPRRISNEYSINNTFISNMEGHKLIERGRQILELAA